MHSFNYKVFFLKYLLIVWSNYSTNPGTGFFKKVYRSPKICRKSGLNSHQFFYLSNLHKKIFILCFNFITNINICKYIFKIFSSNFWMYIMTQRRTASSTTFKDMISTKSILFLFDFFRFSLIFLGLESLEQV